MKQPLENFLGNLFIIMGTLVGLIAVVALGGCTSFSLPQTDFSRLEQTEQMHSDAVEDMKLFRVNGEVSSNDWLEQYGGKLSVVGFVDRRDYAEYHDTGLQQFSLFVPEEVSGLTIYHFIPFFESSETVKEFLDYDDRSDNFDNAVFVDVYSDEFLTDFSLNDTFAQDYRLTRIELSVHNGWIHADTITEYKNVFYPSSELSGFLETNNESPLSMRSNLEKFRPEGQVWLDISSNEIVEISGITSSAGLSMKPDYHLGEVDFNRKDFNAVVHVMVPDRLGTATIYHSARIYFLRSGAAEKFLDLDDSTSLGVDITVPVTLDDKERLIFAGQAAE